MKNSVSMLEIGFNSSKKYEAIERDGSVLTILPSMNAKECIELNSYILGNSMKVMSKREIEANTLYIRFGSIPENGYSQNFTTGENEIGVSVFEALDRQGNINIILPTDTSKACVDIAWMLDRPLYIVQGDIIGIGSIGEPVMKKCSIIKELDIPRVSMYQLMK
jgi:hypothetical protein